jgi:hypothetical protein
MAKSFFEELIKKVSDHYDSDIVLFIGPIDRPYDDQFITRVKNFKRRPNVLLILTTLGGDPHAAYRMARCLQQHYETVGEGALGPASKDESGGKFRLFVDTRCKSAGTILATGANIIMFSEFGEIGPIDVQLRKGDEVGERSSGLTPMHSLERLQSLALKHFEDCFKGLRFGEQMAFTTKMAAEIAREMTVGLYNTIYGQIDPMRIGEFDRALRIASDYGARLGKKTLKDDALNKLLTDYPAHGFVIDGKEAKDIFNTVDEPTKDLIDLANITRVWWNDEYLTADAPLILYLTTDDVLKDEPDEAEPSKKVNDTGGEADGKESKKTN